MKKLLLSAALCGLMAPAMAGQSCCPSMAAQGAKTGAKTTKTAAKSGAKTATMSCPMAAKASKTAGAKTAGAKSACADKVVKFTVAKMTCDGCANGLQAGLAKEKGVCDVKVSYKDKQATVHYNANLTDAKKLEAAFTRKGFPAKQVKS
jgi:periplasmic mercuric ion binding protein